MTGDDDTDQEIRQAILAAQERWAAMRYTIRELARFLGVTETTLGLRMGLSRQTISSRMLGISQMQAGEPEGFALALGVPRAVLDLSPDDAVRWWLDQPGNKLSCRVLGRIAS
jgi:hypothetical protein